MRGSNRGAALLLVILLVSLLAVLVVEFQREARMELRAAENLRDTLQAHALARSGSTVASALVLADLEANDYDFRGGDTWSLLNGLPVPVGDVVISLEVQDLDGKFPIGSLVDDQGNIQSRNLEAYQRFLETLRQYLREQPDLAEADILDRTDPQALADALADWVDRDEDGDYETYEGYTPPNARVTNLEELYRIAGYDAVPEGYTHSVADAILPYLDTRSEAEINVNTAEPPVLAAFHANIDYATAVTWYDDLTERPAETSFRPSDYPAVQTVPFSASPFTPLVKSQRFLADLTVDVGGVSYPAEALLVRDPQRKTVKTAEWREGWIRPRWRHRAPEPPQVPALP